MTKPRRYPELDALRGVAFVLMAIFHLLFNLTFFYDFPIPLQEGIFWIIGRGIATLFLILVGIGSAISLSRHPKLEWWNLSLRRAAIILGCALIVSVSTWMIAREWFVRFGILHLIGVSALFLPLFFPWKTWNLLVGTVLIVVSPFLLSIIPVSMVTLPLGAAPPLFMLDYYPLLPWFGVILIGMGVGHFLYIPTPHTSLQGVQSLPYPASLLWMGRRALFLYIVHQPIILGGLFLLLGIPKT